jgi:hypothetical protein
VANGSAALPGQPNPAATDVMAGPAVELEREIARIDSHGATGHEDGQIAGAEENHSCNVVG